MGWRFAALLICLALGATPALAQERAVCFVPGTSTLAPEGYAALRAAARDFGPSTGRARRNMAVLRPSDGGNVDRAHRNMTVVDPAEGQEAGLDEARQGEMRLELIRLGVPIIRIEIGKDGGDRSPDCLKVEVTEVGPDRPPFIGMWHFWGPYFDTESDAVSEDWRRAMRFLVAGYRPGGTRFCVYGHSDAAEDSVPLSERRADSVRRELVRQGVRWEDVSTYPRGASQLARPTGPGVAEPLNRRVFIDERESCPARTG